MICFFEKHKSMKRKSKIWINREDTNISEKAKVDNINPQRAKLHRRLSPIPINIIKPTNCVCGEKQIK